ncbi:nucleotidyltransferase family protein [Shewanella profunda]|uniref:nucleotidyltransferase family protein n=1 Tax=Shewanella profunda TaxID=254793 RepID=UPI00200BF5BF|nr:nucleotidyltransferase family protein [Shewanella profunda]MCL1091706.1 nucleotidyltransferase family protein [Shewanella profunda]
MTPLALMDRRLLIVVLAAGESKRFGGIKLVQSIPSTSINSLCEQPIICAHIERLQQVNHIVFNQKNQSACINHQSHLLVVLGAYQHTLRPLLERFDIQQTLTLLENPQWQTGLSSSVRLAANYAMEQGFDGILLTLADQVALSVDDYQQLILKWHETGKNVAAHYLDDLGVPAIFNASTLPLLTNLSGDRGAKSILKQQAKLGELVSIALPNAAIDIDTKADLTMWLALKE